MKMFPRFEITNLTSDIILPLAFIVIVCTTFVGCFCLCRRQSARESANRHFGQRIDIYDPKRKYMISLVEAKFVAAFICICSVILTTVSICIFFDMSRNKDSHASITEVSWKFVFAFVIVVVCKI